MGYSNGQKLIQPINHMRATVSYKNEEYKNLVVNGTRMGIHYGMDCASIWLPDGSIDRKIWGMGNGEVLDCGKDSCFGNYLVVKYPQAYNHRQDRYADLIVRLYHLANFGNCHIGMKITKDTRMGEYGDTGTYASGKHLHIEVDEDTVYTHYTPTLSGNTSVFKGRSSKANDKTMSNPLDWIHCKESAPDNQSYTTDGTVYINPGDRLAVKIQ